MFPSDGHTADKMSVLWKRGFDQSDVTQNNSISLAQFDYLVRYKVLYCTLLYIIILLCCLFYSTVMYCTVYYSTVQCWVCTLKRGGEYRKIPAWGRGNSWDRMLVLFCNPRLQSMYRHYQIYKCDEAIVIPIARGKYKAKTMLEHRAIKETIIFSSFSCYGRTITTAVE